MTSVVCHRVWAGAALLAVACAGWGVAQDGGGEASDSVSLSPQGEASEAWQPEPIDAERYRDIVDYNIFRSDRAALARRVEAQRNPPPPVTEVAAPAVEVPVDPDAELVLVGVVLRSPEQLAFVEDRARAWSFGWRCRGSFRPAGSKRSTRRVWCTASTAKTGRSRSGRTSWAKAWNSSPCPNAPRPHLVPNA